jgi:hypothetical protein
VDSLETKVTLRSHNQTQFQRLKPHLFCSVYVVAKATTHKHSRVATQTLKPGVPTERQDYRRGAMDLRSGSTARPIPAHIERKRTRPALQ